MIRIQLPGALRGVWVREGEEVKVSEKSGERIVVSPPSRRRIPTGGHLGRHGRAQIGAHARRRAHIRPQMMISVLVGALEGANSRTGPPGGRDRARGREGGEGEEA